MGSDNSQLNHVCHRCRSPRSQPRWKDPDRSRCPPSRPGYLSLARTAEPSVLLTCGDFLDEQRPYSETLEIFPRQIQAPWNVHVPNGQAPLLIHCLMDNSDLLKNCDQILVCGDMPILFTPQGDHQHLRKQARRNKLCWLSTPRTRVPLGSPMQTSQNRRSRLRSTASKPLPSTITKLILLARMRPWVQRSASLLFSQPAK